jgi:hypothetical protein
MTEQAMPQWFVTSIMGALTAAYPNWPCAPMTVRLFWAVLADCERNDLEAAVFAYVANETQWPTAAGLRRYAKPARSSAAALTASEAWDELYRNRHYRRDQPVWSSESVRRAAEAVRWTDRDWQSEQLPTIRAQFERYYTSLASKAKDEASLEVARNLLAMSRDRKQRIDGPARANFALESGS